MQTILDAHMNKRVAHTYSFKILGDFRTNRTTPLGERHRSAHATGYYVFSS
jgi:hypothetical protein